MDQIKDGVFSLTNEQKEVVDKIVGGSLSLQELREVLKDHTSSLRELSHEQRAQLVNEFNISLLDQVRSLYSIGLVKDSIALSHKIVRNQNLTQIQHAEILSCLAVIHLDMGESSKAIATYNSIIEMQGDDPDLKRIKVDALYNIGNIYDYSANYLNDKHNYLNKVIATYNSIIEMQGDDPELKNTQKRVGIYIEVIEDKRNKVNKIISGGDDSLV